MNVGPHREHVAFGSLASPPSPARIVFAAFTNCEHLSQTGTNTARPIMSPQS